MRLYLLTCESVESYEEVDRRLRLLPQRVALRIPIQWDDENQHIDDPHNYITAFQALSEVADIMIEFVDSSAMKHFTPSTYETHVKNCLTLLGPYCKMAEAGNEVSGNWLGNYTAEKVQRALAACDQVKLPTAVTYYLSRNNPRQMFDWINQHPLRSNYALISNYPNTTPGVQIDMKAIFTEFAQVFPDLPIGWGEYGTEDADDNNSASIEERAALIREVEEHWWNVISPDTANYAGFGGYWDWEADKDLDQVFIELWR